MKQMKQTDKTYENEFEKELAELREWQENQYNPGYYIGTGRVPKPLMGLSRYPKILIGFGVLCLFPDVLLIISKDFGYDSIIGCVMSTLLGGAVIYGGISRLISKRKNVIKSGTKEYYGKH